MQQYDEQTNETGTPEPGDRALAELAALGDRFVMFREEVRTRSDGKEVTTKVPYIPGTLINASSTDPTTWRSYAEADAAAKTGRYDGIMVALGSVGRHFLAGIDVDTCLSEVDGVVDSAPWAKPYLNIMAASYVEASPSRTGAKGFFFLRALAINEVRRLFGIKQTAFGGKVVIEPTGEAHPPSVELYFDRRFFALTKCYWNESADQIAVLELPILQQIAALLPQRVDDAPAQGERDGGDYSWDTTRSGFAWHLALSMAENGDDYDGFCVGLSTFLPDWYAENGKDSHQCRRTWENAVAKLARDAQAVHEAGEAMRQARRNNTTRLRPLLECLPLVDADTIDKARLKQPAWVLQTWAPKRKVTMIAGTAGIGKSAIVTAMSLSVATAQETLG